MLIKSVPFCLMNSKFLLYLVASMYIALFVVVNIDRFELKFLTERIVTILLSIHIVYGFIFNKEIGAGFVSYAPGEKLFGRFILLIVAIFMLIACVVA